MGLNIWILKGRQTNEGTPVTIKNWFKPKTAHQKSPASRLATVYCAFHKHTNSKVQKPPSQLSFSLPSIIITITSNEPWNTEHKKDRNSPITNQKPWPFEPVKVKFCVLRGPLRWLTEAKNAIVSWLLNFRIRMFVKSAVTAWSIWPDLCSHSEIFISNIRR